MAEIKQLKEKKTDEIFYPVTVGEAVIFEDGRSLKDKIEKLSIYIETTYSNLKSLRDNNQLIPGALYRITDYVTTTAQVNTRSAMHQFDIIVQAISESVLSEDARAIQHKFEWPEQCWSDDDGEFATLEGVVKINGDLYYSYTYDIYHYAVNAKNPRFQFYAEEDDGYSYSFLYDYYYSGDEPNWSADSGYLRFNQNISEFSYFSNSNLAAWKLKYCLDNDTDRFAWAKRVLKSPLSHSDFIQAKDSNGTYIYVRDDAYDASNSYAWIYDDAGDDLSPEDYVSGNNENKDASDILRTNTPNVEDIHVGDIIDGQEIIDTSVEGKGVIYQMIDEYNNDCPYDFKNIQFLRSNEWLNTHDSWASDVIGGNYDGYYFYTFSWFDDTNSDNIIIEDVSTMGESDDEDVLQYANNNTILEKGDYGTLYLNNIVIVSSTNYDGGFFYPMKYNTFKWNCCNCSFGNDTMENVFDNYFYDNIFCNITIGNKTFGSVYSIERSEDTKNYIIYSHGGIQFRMIDDAFSGT